MNMTKWAKANPGGNRERWAPTEKEKSGKLRSQHIPCPIKQKQFGKNGSQLELKFKADQRASAFATESAFFYEINIITRYFIFSYYLCDKLCSLVNI